MVGSITDLGRHAITALPAQFLVLCAINAVFVVGLLWFLADQQAARERVLSQIVTGCMQRVQ